MTAIAADPLVEQRRRRFRRQAVAKHEAGHAVVAVLVGIPIQSVVLHDDMSGVCNITTQGQNLWALILTYEAGRCREDTYSRPDDQDHRVATQFLSTYCRARGQRVYEASFRAIQQCGRLLRENWRALEAVTAELDKHGRVSGDRVRQIVHQCRTT